jgi:hypothetical protein
MSKSGRRRVIVSILIGLALVAALIVFFRRSPSGSGGDHSSHDTDAGSMSASTSAHGSMLAPDADPRGPFVNRLVARTTSSSSTVPTRSRSDLAQDQDCMEVVDTPRKLSATRTHRIMIKTLGLTLMQKQYSRTSKDGARENFAPRSRSRSRGYSPVSPGSTYQKILVVFAHDAWRHQTRRHQTRKHQTCETGTLSRSDLPEQGKVRS